MRESERMHARASVDTVTIRRWKGRKEMANEQIPERERAADEFYILL